METAIASKIDVVSVIENDKSQEIEVFTLKLRGATGTDTTIIDLTENRSR